LSLSCIVLKPIGIVRHGYSDEHVKESINGVDGIIEIFPEYRAGLRGLEGFSHIIILAYLHKVSENTRNVLVVRPRGLARKLGIPLHTLPEVGVFSTDSPHRPNPIALTIAKLRDVDKDSGLLYVENIDLYNETPVLDIKPYTPSRRVDNVKIPQWLENILSQMKQSSQNPFNVKY